ncbi:MAG: hypothetical protein ACTHM6_16455 [Tepidisphaeraceae bacterium]
MTMYQKAGLLFAVAASATFASVASASVVSTGNGTGEDGFLQFKNTTALNSTGTNLLTKIQWDSTTDQEDGTTGQKVGGNDRLTLLKFDTSTLSGPFTAATLQMKTSTDTSNPAKNVIPANQVLQLWGIPDLANQEDWTSVTNNTTFAYGTGNNSANPNAVTGTPDDGTGNRLKDASLILLGTYAQGATTSSSTGGTVITFTPTSDFAPFLANDTNGFVSMIVGFSSNTKDPLMTTAFFSKEDTDANAMAPTLLTNADAVAALPEPGGLLAAAGSLGLTLRRRRSARR